MILINFRLHDTFSARKALTYLHQSQMLLGIGQSKQLKAGHPCVHVPLSNLDKLQDELDFESKTDRELVWLVRRKK